MNYKSERDQNLPNQIFAKIRVDQWLDAYRLFFAKNYYFLARYWVLRKKVKENFVVAKFWEKLAVFFCDLFINFVIIFFKRFRKIMTAQISVSNLLE